MRSSLTLVSLAAVGHSYDCSALYPWTKQMYTGGQMVHQDDKAYRASWATTAFNEPANGTPWLLVEECDPGTAGEGPALTGSYDCTSLYPWAPKMYTGGQLVHRNERAYRASWSTTAGNDPANGIPWVLVEACAPGTAGDGPTVDCSEAYPWKAKPWDSNTKHQVHYEGVLYSQEYYAEAFNVPGQSQAWLRMGRCTPGTEGSGPAGSVLDCSTYPEWYGQLTYPKERGSRVHLEGKAFENKWWTQGDSPVVESKSQPWEELGDCQPGTDTMPSPPSGYEMTPEQEEQVCTCCAECAKIEVTGPVCIPKKTESNCYFAWCPKYNNFDVEKCKEVKASNVLNFYNQPITPGKKVWPKRVFAPYFDSGLAQFPKLTQVYNDLGVGHFIAAFIVSSNIATITGCHGAWAGAYPVKMGPVSWNQTKGNNDYLFEEISNLRDMGGDVVVSFGGAMNVELADSKVCQSAPDPVAALVEAYSEVIDFVKLTHIDFDIEGAAYSAVNQNTGWKYRFAAVKQLEEKYPDLKVWWTLPILPTGLTDDGLKFLHDLMASGVRLDLFNVMNMDYGDDTICPGNQMGDCEIRAMENLAKQAFETARSLNLLSRYGWKTVEDVYPNLGSIPMVGKNDIVTETYTLEDAANSLNEWMTKKPIGFVSYWSLGRDMPCPDKQYVDVSCSSYPDQSEEHQFAKIFAPLTSA